MTTSSGRTAAVIGAGQTGVTAALGLLDNGFDVTVYSDRDQRSLRDDVPATGTALIFGAAQRAEESLGLNTYLATAPTSTGESVRVLDGSGPDRTEAIAFDADFDGFVGVAVDTRLKADDRLTLFRQRGGRFVVEAVDPARLDAIAAGVDLTLVATGRGGLSSLFPVDAERSAYDRPQRSLLTVTVSGLPYGPDIFAHRSAAGGRHNALTVVTDQGESWLGGYLHKDAGPTWTFLGWARPGSEWERRFAAADSPQSAVRTRHRHRAVPRLHRLGPTRGERAAAPRRRPALMVERRSHPSGSVGCGPYGERSSGGRPGRYRGVVRPDRRPGRAGRVDPCRHPGP